MRTLISLAICAVLLPLALVALAEEEVPLVEKPDVAAWRANLISLGSAPQFQAGARGAAQARPGAPRDQSLSGRPSRTQHFEIHVNEWSSDDVVKKWFTMLKEEGPDAVRDEFWRVEVGWIRVGTSLGYPVSVARSRDTEDGRIVRAVLDRPIQMFEVMQNLRSQDHIFGVIELRLDKDGNGEGTLIAAAEIEFNEAGELEVTSLGTQPMQLNNVRPL